MSRSKRGVANALLTSFIFLLHGQALAVAPVAGRVDYDILLAGRKAGAMSVTSDGHGGSRSDYRFNDRGRGPALHSETRINRRGIPVRLTVKGVNYLKSPIDEKFQRSAKSTRWESAADAGTTSRAGFYLPAQVTSYHLEMLARALLQAPGHKLALIPAGEAELIRERTVTRGSARDAPSATLYLITGLDYLPLPLWLDRNHSLVAEGSGWEIVARKDWVSAVDRLRSAQDEVLATRQREAAARLTHKPDGDLLFQNVRLFDAENKSMVPAMDVRVHGDRIEKVGARGSIPAAGAMIIEGSGKTLLPGLWDMHVHLSPIDGVLDIASGVTSVRDLANDVDELAEMKRQFESGELIGPRVLAAGLIDGPGPYTGPTKAVVSTPEQLAAAIADYKARGYPQVKVYSSFDPKLVPLAVKEAHRLGLRISGHVPAGMTMAEFVSAGADEVHHANFWLLNFMGPEVTEHTNDMTRFYALGDRGKDIDLESQEVRSFISLLRSSGVEVDPTVGVFHNMLLSKPRSPEPGLAAVADRLPPVVRRQISGGGLARSDERRKTFSASYQRMIEMLKAVHDAGVTIVAGTDDMAGFMLHNELEEYVRAGIPVVDVLQIATIGAARVMSKDRDLGSIQDGKLADLILVEGNPGEDIRSLRNVDLVVKNGAIFRPNELFAFVGVEPANRKMMSPTSSRP